MANPVTWFQVQGPEAKPLQRFYKKVFAWRMTSAPGGAMTMVEPEEGGIGGGIAASGDGIASVAVYIDVDDLVKYLKKIKDAGGKTSLMPTKLPGTMGSIAAFIDPAGNWIGLWQRVKKAGGKSAGAKKAGAKKAVAKKAVAKKAASKSAVAKPTSVAKKATKRAARASKG